MKKLKLFIATFFIATYALATTYYVSPSGNNSSNGHSTATAFLTLQHAADVVSAGDSVIVLAGTYSGFYHTTSGTVSQQIIFHAMPGVIINEIGRAHV